MNLYDIKNQIDFRTSIRGKIHLKPSDFLNETGLVSNKKTNFLDVILTKIH